MTEFLFEGTACVAVVGTLADEAKDIASVANKLIIEREGYDKDRVAGLELRPFWSFSLRGAAVAFMGRSLNSQTSAVRAEKA